MEYQIHRYHGAGIRDEVDPFNVSIPCQSTVSAHNGFCITILQPTVCFLTKFALRSVGVNSKLALLLQSFVVISEVDCDLFPNL